MATAYAPTDEAEDVASAAPSIVELAQSRGDISSLLDDQTLASIGFKVVEDYRRDLSDRQEWEDVAREGLKKAAQEKRQPKNYPFRSASNVDFPILAVAAMQFWARAYPALCRSGNMVTCKVIGSDKGRPKVVRTEQGPIPVVSLGGQEMLAPQAQQMLAQLQAEQPPQQAGPDGQPMQAPQMPKPEPMWEIPPGTKQKRADRVASYMNVYLEFRVKNWQRDTSSMLLQLPTIGCGFRKVWVRGSKQSVAYVSGLDLIVPSNVSSLDECPRTTERMPDVFPFQIKQRMNRGEYRTVVLPAANDDDECPRLLLEQHRLLDLDGDGVDEPYIITVDEATSQVLRLEANYGLDDIEIDETGGEPVVVAITPNQFYVKYGFIPNPNGSIYDLGFAHLLSQIGPIINTTINQIFDAEHARIAGGGWIASGLRLQSNGQSARMTWQPGEYKTVNVSGGALRDSIVERTFPNESPMMFQLLDLMLGAAKEITSIKDVVTGEAPNNAPVGTTLALIEQGLQFFTAIYKWIYLSFGEEFALLRSNLAEYGGEEAAEDYDRVLDDPEADFAKDFADRDTDIKPVADPTSVTSMQKAAKSGLLKELMGHGLNDMEILRRILEAANIEDIDALMPPENAPPNPMVIAQLRKETSIAAYNEAKAQATTVEAVHKAVETGQKLGGGDA
jgi:chaperonin GroES